MSLFLPMEVMVNDFLTIQGDYERDKEDLIYDYHDRLRDTAQRFAEDMHDWALDKEDKLTEEGLNDIYIDSYGIIPIARMRP